MEKLLQSIGLASTLALFALQWGGAQPCYQLGATVGQLSPILKSTPAGVCPTPAQASSVCDCPAGYVAVGYEGQEGNSYGPMVLSQFKLRCRQLNTDGTLGGTVVVTCSNGTAAGNVPDGPVDAAAGQALVGFEVRIGCAVDGIMGASKTIADIAAGTPNSASNTMPPIGGMGGSAQPIMYAPNGNVIVGMQSYIDPGNNFSAGVAWRYAPIINCTPPPPPPPPPPPGTIPTMSEWGLILFALILFTLSVVFGTQRQRAMAMANSFPASAVNSRRRLPFNKQVFLKVLPAVYLGIIAVFTVAIRFFGYELTAADPAGSLMAGGIVAYLVHFVIISSNKENQ